jgi:transcriptional regulator with XRE-family HTH domain
MKKDMVSLKFGEKLRKERIKRGLSQEKLAELADLNRNYIGMIERAERNVTLMNIAKIAKAMKMKVNKLVDA